MKSARAERRELPNTARAKDRTCRRSHVPDTATAEDRKILKAHLPNTAEPRLAWSPAIWKFTPCGT
jgi:hypothetical protein